MKTRTKEISKIDSKTGSFGILAWTSTVLFLVHMFLGVVLVELQLEDHFHGFFQKKHLVFQCLPVGVGFFVQILRETWGLRKASVSKLKDIFSMFSNVVNLGGVIHFEVHTVHLYVWMYVFFLYTVGVQQLNKRSKNFERSN